MATQTEPGIPSLLVEAARSAAAADGLEAPEAAQAPASIASSNHADTSAAAAALTSIGADQPLATATSTSSSSDPMERARAAVAAAASQAQNAPTAGSAAFLASASSPAPASRRMPAPAPTAAAPVATAPMSSSGKKKGPPLRRGKWTAEEEAYANRLILEFKAGLLPLTDGTTLRTFLSKLLNCDPMRISKKFVGNNCIGKQVFRRRTADINRLTPEQIQQNRAELSELERRFLERVAQTNRVKSSGVNAPGGGAAAGITGTGGGVKLEDGDNAPPSPPWLQPPLGYKHGTGAAMAAAALSGGSANSRAAAAGRALLQGLGGGTSGSQRKSSNPALASSGSAGFLAMAELHRRNSQQNLLQNALANRSSATNLLAAAAGSGLSNSAVAQIARNLSAARLAGLTAAGNSMNNLMLRTGMSRDQLSQLAGDQANLASANSFSNMMERQSSFDALMSLDFHSLQSIDNLANLIQSGSGAPGQVPETGMKNWSADSSNTGSSGNLSSLADARRLASAGRMESLLRSLSSSNVNKGGSAGESGGGDAANSSFSNVLQSMQGTLGASGNSTNSLFGSGGNISSAMSLANLLRADSSTGLTALRMQDGLNHRNTSVDDFLSLVASGDISHHDPLLTVPLMHQQRGQGKGGAQAAAAQLLAQQQLLAQASSGNSALANALRAGSLNSLRSGGSGANLNAAVAQQAEESSSNKRKLETESSEERPAKR